MTALSVLFSVWSFIKTPIGRWLLIGVAVGIALFFLYRDIKAKGYAECKAQWNESIFQTKSRVNDAVDRARTDTIRGVPDRFDSDR